MRSALSFTAKTYSIPPRTCEPEIGAQVRLERSERLQTQTVINKTIYFLGERRKESADTKPICSAEDQKQLHGKLFPVFAEGLRAFTAGEEWRGGGDEDPL